MGGPRGGGVTAIPCRCCGGQKGLERGAVSLLCPAALRPVRRQRPPPVCDSLRPGADSGPPPTPILPPSCRRRWRRRQSSRRADGARCRARACRRAAPRRLTGGTSTWRAPTTSQVGAARAGAGAGRLRGGHNAEGIKPCGPSRMHQAGRPATPGSAARNSPPRCPAVSNDWRVQFLCRFRFDWNIRNTVTLLATVIKSGTITYGSANGQESFALGLAYPQVRRQRRALSGRGGRGQPAPGAEGGWSRWHGRQGGKGVGGLQTSRRADISSTRPPTPPRRGLLGL